MTVKQYDLNVILCRKLDPASNVVTIPQMSHKHGHLSGSRLSECNLIAALQT